jgi:NAD(P)-dependent dehydrogenase (short-subunit alcohol dehydrogenase family)
MADRFQGKAVLVAGGTGGLGRAVTLAFLNEGAAVHVTYRSEGEFTSLQSAAGQSAQSSSGLKEAPVIHRVAPLYGHRADVTNEQQVTTLLEKFARIDVLVNTVGAYAGGTPLWQTGLDVYERMMSQNVRSGFVLARAAVPLMLAQKSGLIVNISSRAAVDHAAGASAYAASKAAAVAMMDSLAADVMGKGVRVNTVLPSIIDTAANRAAMPDADFSKWPKPEEIAQVILFLASEEAKLIHGASVPVYGTS